MFLLYTLITGLCTYSCLKYAKLESKNQRYRIFDRFHVEAPKHMMSLIEFTEETNDDDSHLYNCMYTDNFYDGYMLDKIDQSTQHEPSLDGTSYPFTTQYEELYMNPRKYKIMKKRKYYGNDQRPREDTPDNILEKIHDNMQKKTMLDFLQQPISPDHKIKAYEKVFPYSSGLHASQSRPSEYALPHSKPVFSTLNMIAGELMKDFDTPEF